MVRDISTQLFCVKSLSHSHDMINVVCTLDLFILRNNARGGGKLLSIHRGDAFMSVRGV